jgi:hypothetical protein
MAREPSVRDGDGAGAGAGAGAGFVRANRVSLLALVVAVGLAAAVYLSTPRGHGLSSLWVLLFSLTPFAAATVAIAWLDQPWARRLRLPLILPPLCFLIFFAVFVPYVFVLFGRNDFDRYYDDLYNAQLMVVPFVILALVLSIRLGGGSRSTVVRLAAAMLLLQLSGIEDLAVLLIRDLGEPNPRPIPQVWDWADHMAVRLGHHPSKYEAYVFIAVHLAAAVAVLAVPGRLVRGTGRRLRSALRRGRSGRAADRVG